MWGLLLSLIEFTNSEEPSGFDFDIWIFIGPLRIFTNNTSQN